MAREVVVRFRGAECSFGMEKLDRARLYGQRRRLTLDPSGEPCERAELTADGDVVLRLGMTGQGYLARGWTWVAASELVGLDPSGQPLRPVPSTLGVPQDATPAEPRELLDVSLKAVYMLTAPSAEVEEPLLAALRGGAVLRVPFRYHDGFQEESAWLVANEHGVFCVVGSLAQPEWARLEQPVTDPLDEDASDDGDLDFEMF